MKIVFHERFYDSGYADNAAAAPLRLEPVVAELRSISGYSFVSPAPACEVDLLLAHSTERIRQVREDPRLFEMAALAVGGACLAGELAFAGEPSFALVRPPGHHASRASGWGYCEFANIGIALLKLKQRGSINSAFVLDFDAHTGDGTLDVLACWPEVRILNPFGDDNKEYLRVVEEYVRALPPVDIVAVSAGFDIFEKDLGKKLTRFDFYVLGRMMKGLSKKMGHGRRFAVLEGGYYLPELGPNVGSFCAGFA